MEDKRKKEYQKALKKNIKFMLKDRDVEFVIVTTIPNELMQKNLDGWLLKAHKYSDRIFAKYLRRKFPSHKVFTEREAKQRIRRVQEERKRQVEK